MGKIAVYLSNDNLSLIEATAHRDALNIERYVKIPIPMGAIINGVIIQEEMVKDVIKQLKQYHVNEVHLVIDSGQIIFKHITIPKLKKNEIYQYIKEELSTLSQESSDLIYDYAYLDKMENIKGASSILAVAANRQLVDTYIHLFKECGIQILDIDFAISGLIRMTKEFPGFSNKTYIISKVNQRHLLSSLFIANEYSYTYRTRLMTEKNTEAFTNELMGTLSHMIQSNNRSDSVTFIDELFFLGLTAKEEEKIYPVIEQQLNIKISQLPDIRRIHCIETSSTSFKLADYLLPTSYFFRKEGKGLKNKEIDLLSAFHRRDEEPKYYEYLKKSLLPIGLLLAFCAVGGFYTYKNHKINQENQQLENEIQNVQNQIKALGGEDLDQIQYYQEIVNDIETFNTQQANYPSIESRYVETIEETLLDNMTIRNIEYQRSEKSIEILVYSYDVLNFEKYVTSLKETNMFENVVYDQYQQVSEAVMEEVDGQTIMNQQTQYHSTITLTLQ